LPVYEADRLDIHPDEGDGGQGVVIWWPGREGAVATRHSRTNTPSSDKWRSAFSKHRIWSSCVRRSPIRVVHGVNHPVRASGTDAGHVADRYLDLARVGLLAQPINHVADGSLPSTRTPAVVSGRAMRPVPTRTPAHPARRRVGRGTRQSQPRHFGCRPVVALRLLVSEAGPGVEAFHVVFVLSECDERRPRTDR
jgi:hypothetical protein